MIEEKIQELSWKSEFKTILLIDWLNELLAKLPEEKKEEEVKEEEKPVKKKITFKRK